MPVTEILGLSIHYHAPRDRGEGPGQRVLYVHGTGCNAGVWDAHMGAIADAHTPVAIDLPGHGRSEGGGFRGMADHAEFVIGLADALGWSRFVLAGHSMGGGIAITAALYHPERIAGLVLVDTGARLRVAPDLLRSARAAAASGKYHRYLQERIPGCRLVVIERAGHWSFHEQPTQFDHAVRAFLAGLPAGKGDQR
jgi:pimeloyl-ACP methyl ester carboxylesterase